MAYEVHIGKRHKVFETLEEANKFSNDIQRETKIVALVTETKKKVNSIYAS